MASRVRPRGVLAEFPPGAPLDAGRREVWRRDPLAAIEHASQQCGALFTLREPGKPARVLVGAPGALREIFIGRGADLEALGSSFFRPLVGEHSLGQLNDAPHRRYRRLLTPAFQRRAVRDFGPRVQGIVDEALARGLACQPVSLRVIAINIAQRVALLCCFGALSEQRLIEVRDAFDAALASLCAGAAEAEAEADRSLRRLDAVLFRLIQAAMAAPDLDEHSVLNRLLAARRDGLEIPTRAIRDQLVTLMVAGQESTAVAIEHGARLIVTDPAVGDRLRAELAGQDGTLDAIGLAGLPYLTAVIAEVLRLASVVPMGLTRRVRTGFAAAGHWFPAGIEVAPCIHAAHRDPARYPRPASFEPERFRGNARRAMSYIPYGLGSRRCLGATLADLEIKLTLAALVRYPGLEVRIGENERLASRSVGPAVRTRHALELSTRDAATMCR